jgi:hypothetical protein
MATSITSLSQQAEDCRKLAARYRNRPEAPFLLRVANEFDRLENITRKKRPGREEARAAVPSRTLQRRGNRRVQNR